MSSRNKHLAPQQRQDALVLSAGLKRAEEMIGAGRLNVNTIEKEIRHIIMKGNPDRIDYISAVRYADLGYVEKIEEKSVIALAAFWGSTRLIDNMIIDKTGGGFKCIY